jgi:hypothetical protein
MMDSRKRRCYRIKQDRLILVASIPLTNGKERIMSNGKIAIAPDSQKTEKINRTVTKKLYGKQKPLPGKPFLEEMMPQYYHAVKVFFRAFGSVLFIAPVIIVGIMEAISAGFLAGMKRIVVSYESHLEKR